jgi:hypothetical protein
MLVISSTSILVSEYHGAHDHRIKIPFLAPRKHVKFVIRIIVLMVERKVSVV